MLVEISATTVAYDLRRKAAIYAANRVPEYWVVDVPGRTIHQMWGSDGKLFPQTRKFAFGDPIDAATIPDLFVDTAYL